MSIGLRTRSSRHLGTAAAIVALLGLAVGCGKNDEKFISVEGNVKYKGKALETGAVVFLADAAKGNTTTHEPRGSIKGDGTYEILTAGKPGAPPGWYKVTIISSKSQDPKNPYAMPVSLIPKNYGDVSKSGLAVEVKEQPAPGVYDFDLK